MKFGRSSNAASQVLATYCEPTFSLHTARCPYNLMQWVNVEEEDISNPDVLKAVEAAVRRSTSVKRISIVGVSMNWTNVATAILKGAAQSKVLRTLELTIGTDFPALQEVVDDVRTANPNLKLVVMVGRESTSHEIASLYHQYSCPHVLYLSGVCIVCCLTTLYVCGSYHYSEVW